MLEVADRVGEDPRLWTVLGALRELHHQDSAGRVVLDGLLRGAAMACEAPLALVSVFHEEHLWFKSFHGFARPEELPRNSPFCHMAIRQNGVLEVPDAAVDEQLATTPGVICAPHVRFFAGVPLRLANGEAIGALSVMDYRPRRLDARAREALQIAGRAMVMFLSAPSGEAESRDENGNLVRRGKALQEIQRLALKSLAEGVIITDMQGLVTWLNPPASRLTGWGAGEATGRPLDEVFHVFKDEAREPVEDPVRKCLALGEAVDLGNQAVLVSRLGDEIGIEDVASPIRDDHGTQLGVVQVFRDVTEKRRMSGEISYRASHDALTGLVNRAEFENRLRRILARPAGERGEHALLYIDLDRFKAVNDACGHAAGDELLRQVSRLLAQSLRSRDTLARLGGDEFGVMLEHCTSDQAQRVAQQICDLVEDFRFDHEGRRFRVGSSIGLVPIDRRWESQAALMQAADAACYAAKEAGRNRVHAWLEDEPDLRRQQGQIQWASRIERALEENAFELWAQKVFPLATETAPGLNAEVLVRLTDAQGEAVLPGAFLPTAARFHLASRIDRWVLARVLEVLADRAVRAVVGSLWINLSGQSLADRAFLRHLIDSLAEAGSEVCARLVLEVPEAATVGHLADAALLVEKARALGVRVAIDDFGLGPTSFGYLKTLKPDVLKIDGQFIRELMDDALNDAAVRCFVDVAHELGVKTVAEAVETFTTVACLRGHGVDFGQGYLLHRPEPLASLLRH